MKIGKFELPWSEVGKLAAGIVTVILAFFVFLNVGKGYKTIALVILAAAFFGYRHITNRRNMSASLEKKLKEKDKAKYG